MTNRGIKTNSTDNTSKKNPRNKRRCHNVFQIIVMIVNVVLSSLAIIVSVFALYNSIYYDKKESEYKIGPQLEVLGAPKIEKDSLEGSPKMTLSMVQINILEKNNLDQAYAIHSDGEVEKLPLDNIENTLEGQVKYNMQQEPNIVSGQYEYRYFFLYLKSLDGDGNLHLIYIKTSPENMVFNGVSGIEVYGLQNTHQNEKAYEGEKFMAEEYVRILENLPKYLG